MHERGVTQPVRGYELIAQTLFKREPIRTRTATPITIPNPDLAAKPNLNPNLDLPDCVPTCMEGRITSARVHGGRAAWVAGVGSHSSQALV